MLTVGLPMFKSGNIAWLALESLCNQIDPPPWELLVAQEMIEPFLSLDRLNMDYTTRLQDNNCKRITWGTLTEWVPLSQKWGQLAQTASPDSEIFLLQAADDYAQPWRLRETWEEWLRAQFDWAHMPQGIFYNIQAEETMVYTVPDLQHETGFDMAVRTDLLRAAPVGLVSRGVDGHLMQVCRPKKIHAWRAENWTLGFLTYGQNVICDHDCSGTRFKWWGADPRVSPEILARLKAMKGLEPPQRVSPQITFNSLDDLVKCQNANKRLVAEEAV